MQRALFIGICLAVSAWNCAAQADPARVRAAIHLPHLSVRFDIEFSPHVRRSAATSFTDPDPAVRVAALQKALRGGPSDAAAYIQIAESYDPVAPGAAVKITAAYTKAITLLRQQLSKRPRDGWVMSQLGEALCGVNAAAEGEKWLQQAVQDAPTDWRCWTNLGDHIQIGSLNTILESDKVGLASYADIAAAHRLLEPFGKKQGLDKSLDAFVSSQKLARDAYDKAVMVAPTVSEPYNRRFTFRMFDLLWAQNIVRVAHGDQPDYSLLKADSVLNDEWKAAELSPDDANLQYNALVNELRCYADKLSAGQLNDLATGLQKLPADRRARVAQGLTRLSKCADTADHATSASILVALASLYFLLGDVDDASHAVVRAAAQDPNNQQAAKAVIATYLAQKRYAELATVLQEQIKHQDSPYSRLCLAHVYSAMGNYAGVSEQVLTGLKLFPSDLLLNLALADALMKAKDADSLKKAGEEISFAQDLFDKLPANEKQANQANFDVTRGIYFALIGKPDVARLALQRVLNDDPDNAEAKEALAAVGVQ